MSVRAGSLSNQHIINNEKRNMVVCEQEQQNSIHLCLSFPFYTSLDPHPIYVDFLCITVAAAYHQLANPSHPPPNVHIPDG